MVPARRAVREDPGFKKLTAQATFAQEIPFMHFTPPVPGLDVVRVLTLDQALNSAVLLREDPRSALRTAAKRANTLLADNRQKYGV